MSSQHKNGLPELVELRARLREPHDNQSEQSLAVELRIGKAELEDESSNLLTLVQTKRALVSLDCSGLEITPGSRTGEPLREGVVTTKRTDKAEAQTSAELSGQLAGKGSTEGSASGSLALAAKGEKKWSRTETRETSSEEQHIFVKALGGQRWEVTEPEGAPLDGTYLNDTTICGLVSTKGANRQSVSLAVEIKQKDLLFPQLTAISKLTKTKRKVLQVLLSKASSLHTVRMTEDSQ